MSKKSEPGENQGSRYHFRKLRTQNSRSCSSRLSRPSRYSRRVLHPFRFHRNQKRFSPYSTFLPAEPFRHTHHMHLAQTNQTVNATIRNVPMRKAPGISLAQRWSRAKVLQQGGNYDGRRLSHYILRHSPLGSRRLFRRNLDLGRLKQVLSVEFLNFRLAPRAVVIEIRRSSEAVSQASVRSVQHLLSFSNRNHHGQGIDG